MGGITKNLGGIAGGLGGFALGGPIGAGIGYFAGDALTGGGMTDKLFGNNIPSELKRPRLTSFTAPGLSAQFVSPENLQIIRSPGVNSMLEFGSNVFQNQTNQLGALRPLVEPGFGRLTEAGINAVRDARRASMGDLRQNLARRRVRGSSFGADDISRTAAEFAKRENEFASEAFIKEMALTQDLINQEAQAAANSYLQNLSQTNFETSLAAQLSSGVTSVLSNNAQIIGGMSNRSGDTLLNTIGGLGSFAASRQWPIPTRQV